MNKLLLNIQMFAEFNANLEDLIKKHTVEDVFNKEEALKDLNEQILKYNSKNQPKVETFKDKAREEVIKELGIDNVTNENQLKAHIASLSSDEKSQNLIDLKAKYDVLNDTHIDLTGKYTDATGKLIGLENGKYLLGKGVNPDYIDFLAHTIGQQVNEETDFSKAYETYATSNPQYFNATQQPNKPLTTGKPQVADQSKPVSGVRQVLIKQGLLKE